MMMAGNGVRAGYAVASSLIHLPLSDDRDRSQIAKNLRLLGLLGHEVPAGLEPRVCFTLPELDHARDLVAGDPNRPIAVFEPLSFEELALFAKDLELVLEFGFDVALTYSPDGDFLLHASLGNSVAIELAFGGVNERMGRQYALEIGQRFS